MSTSYDLDLLLKYPMIMQRQSSEEEYFGYIKVKGDHYKIGLSRNMKRYKLEMNEDLEKHEKEIRKLTRQCFPDPVEFLDKLTEILSIETQPQEEILQDHTSIYRKVLQEYSELKQFYFNIHKSTISSNLKTINIIQLDEACRQHALKIQVDYARDDDKIFSIIQYDLPEIKSGTTFEPSDSLSGLYESFITRVDCPKLQMIFNVLDEIDRGCWVVDPQKPSRKDLHRRIILDTNLSIIITFNLSDMRDLPQVKFLGPHNLVKKYNEIVSRNFLHWNPNEDILDELLRLLEIEAFPSKPTEIQADELLVNEGECCICFSSRLNEQLPDIICQNSSCNQFFHTECLYQWLCSLNSRKFYYEIYGQCPNCEKTIRCPLPSLA